MPHLQAQVSLKYFTGLDEDVATNTWHFGSPDPPALGDLIILSGRLNAFYGAIAGNLSNVISSMQTKIYLMTDPIPRIPVYVGTEWDPVTGGGTNSGAPEEMAICMSFQAAIPSGSIPARRKGRLYLGPLSNNTLTLGSDTAFCRFNTGFMTAVNAAALEIADPTADCVWMQYSKTTGELHPIERGWVDDSPDTQRRRGHRASLKMSWVQP